MQNAMTLISSSALTGLYRPQTRSADSTQKADGTEKTFDLSKLAYLKTETEDEDDSSAIQEDPKVAQYSREKNQAKETLERLIKELKMVRKVWANDPEELAKQLVRLGDELKKVMEVFKKAQKALAALLKEQSGLSSSMSGAMPNIAMPSAPAQTANTDDTQTREGEADTAPAENAADTSEDPDAGTINKSDLAQGLAAYAKADTARIRLDQTPYAYELRGDIEFAHGMRGFATSLRDAFDEVRKKAANLPGHSEEQEKFFDDVEDYLKELESDAFDYVGSLQRAMPPAIYVSLPAQAPAAAQGGY